MFDIGFAELVIIAVVALLVIGPERLPEAIRTGSAWLNRFRRGFNEIKNEVQQELHNDAVLRDLRESGDKLRRETQTLRDDIAGHVRETDADLKADAKRRLDHTESASGKKSDNGSEAASDDETNRPDPTP
jgi:sec-independent protein translocase protein TatB